MGVSRQLMVAWDQRGDQAAIRRLLAKGAQYSATESLNNRSGAYGEYPALAGGRRRSSTPGERQGRHRLPSGRVIEVKVRSSPTGGWPLQYRPSNGMGLCSGPFREDELAGHRGTACAGRVARRFVTGSNNTLRRDGPWMDYAKPRLCIATKPSWDPPRSTPWILGTFPGPRDVPQGPARGPGPDR